MIKTGKCLCRRASRGLQVLLGGDSLAFGGGGGLSELVETDRSIVGGTGKDFGLVGWETEIFGGGGREPSDDGVITPVEGDGAIDEEENSEDMPDVSAILEVTLERLKLAEGGALERPGMGTFE